MPEQRKALGTLKRVRERTVSEISRLKRELQAEVEPVSATDDDAAADVASEVYERGKMIFRIQTLEAKLRSLDNAIAAARSGTYGICEMCGVVIPEERLSIVPETTLCVQCASKMEQSYRRWQIGSDQDRPGRRPTAASEWEAEDEDAPHVERGQ